MRLFALTVGENETILKTGYPIITYDDEDTGDYNGTGKDGCGFAVQSGTRWRESVCIPTQERDAFQESLTRTLTNLKVVDNFIAGHFDRVDGLGLSGGADRMFHYLVLHDAALKSAYIVNYFDSPWLKLDYYLNPHTLFTGADTDTRSSGFEASLQFSELALVALNEKVDLSFASSAYDGFANGLGHSNRKNFLEFELKSTVRSFTHRFDVGGDDPCSFGESMNEHNLGHEIDLLDYLRFLQDSRAHHVFDMDRIPCSSYTNHHYPSGTSH